MRSLHPGMPLAVDIADAIDFSAKAEICTPLLAQIEFDKNRDDYTRKRAGLLARLLLMRRSALLAADARTKAAETYFRMPWFPWNNAEDLHASHICALRLRSLMPALTQLAASNK